MDDDAITVSPEGRVVVVVQIINRVVKAGIPIEDIVIDPLAITMGADFWPAWLTTGGPPAV